MASLPSLTSQPPKVTRLVSQDGQSYALAGWTSFLAWARDHDRLVHEVDDAARQLGYSPEDRERVVLHALVIDRHEGSRKEVPRIALLRGAGF